MNRHEFVDKYIGTPVDFDGMYGAQCVDLIRQYWKDVWGFTRQPEPVEGASDFFYLHSERPIQKELCVCTPYVGAVQPPAGSVLVFKPSGTNKYGHVAICLETTNKCITVFEQNGITNQKAIDSGEPQKGACISVWNYERLLGWLEKKEAA